MAAEPSLGPAVAVEAAALAQESYLRHSAAIFAHCVSRLRNRHDAEDALQATFLNALRAYRRGVVPELELAWLFAIANRVIANRYRADARRCRIESPYDLDELQDVLAAPVPAAGELLRLREALERMPEQQRRALLLREWQGLSCREIADDLGSTAGAVEQLLFRARRSLRSELERPEPRLRRLRGLGIGSLLLQFKELLGVAGAAKTVALATAVVVTAGAVAPREPLHHHVTPPPTSPARAPSSDRSAAASAAPRPASARRMRPLALLLPDLPPPSFVTDGPGWAPIPDPAVPAAFLPDVAASTAAVPTTDVALPSSGTTDVVAADPAVSSDVPQAGADQTHQDAAPSPIAAEAPGLGRALSAAEAVDVSPGATGSAGPPDVLPDDAAVPADPDVAPLEAAPLDAAPLDAAPSPLDAAAETLDPAASALVSPGPAVDLPDAADGDPSAVVPDPAAPEPGTALPSAEDPSPPAEEVSPDVVDPAPGPALPADATVAPGEDVPDATPAAAPASLLGQAAAPMKTR